MVKNLADALERVLAREHRAIRAAAQEGSLAPGPHEASLMAPDRERHSQDKQARRERRLNRYEEAHRLFRQGMNVTRVAAALGLSRPTVRKFLHADAFPEQAVRAPRPSRLAPFVPYLHQRWHEGCHNSGQLWREVQEKGFDGGATIVRDLLRSRCRSGLPANVQRQGGTRTPAPSPRAAVWLLLKGSAMSEQASFVEPLCRLYPKIEKAKGLSLAFWGLVRERRAADPDGWIAEAQASGLSDMKSFAQGLMRDRAAVMAGLSQEWSNGPTEGHGNRLKAVKRQMYGRAGFEMLRRRVILAA